MAKVLGFSINIQGTEQAVETAEQLRRAIADLQKELKKTDDVDSIKKLEKQLIDLKASQQDVNAQIREEIKLRRTELNAVDDTTGAYAKMSKTLNDQRKRYKDLAAAGQEFTKEALDIRTEITQLDARLKDIDASVGQFQRNVGGYSQALSQFFPRITQRFGEVQTGFAKTAGAAGVLNKSMTVLLIAVTVFNEIGAALTAATEASKEFNAVSKRLVQTTNQTGDALKDNVGTVIALSRVYQQESNEIVNAANAVAKEFGIEYSTALELIEAGFRKGSNAQGQFLDQLREYPAQAAAAGVSAEQLFSIFEVAANEGIYSDKLVDSVKEFSLRIKEQTKPTRDALENAFGRDFTDKLLRDVDKGAITAFQALQKVSNGLKDVGLSASQTQRVITDVFGGPGEDAGLRAIQLLADVESGFDEVTASANKYEEQQEKLFDATQELAQAQARLADATVKTGAEFDLVTVKGRIFLADIATGLLDFFNKIPALWAGLNAFLRSEVFFENPFKEFNRAYTETLAGIEAQDAEALRVAAEARLKTEEGLQEKLAQLRNEREGATPGSAYFIRLTREIKQFDEQLAAVIKASRDKARKDGAAAGTATGKSFVEGSIAAIQKRANDLQKAITEAVAGSEAQAKLIAAYKVQEKLLEKAIEARNRLEFEGTRDNQLRQVQQIESLAGNLLNLQLDEGDRVFRSLMAQGKKLNDERFRTEIQQNLDRNKALAEQNRQAQLSQKAQIIEFIQEGVSQTFNLINAITAAGNQRRNEVFAQQISDTEAKIAEIESRAQQATGIRKRLFEQQAAGEKRILEKQRQDAEAEQKKQRKAEKRNALIVSVIQGVLAVQRALASPPGPPFTVPQAIATGIFSALQTATIAAQPLATGGVVGISGRKVNDRQNMRTRGNGDNVLATVKRGEVVLNQRQQAALGGAQTFRSIRVPGFAAGGIASPSISAPRLPSVAADSRNAIAALDRKTDAINARLDRVKVFVVTEDIARDMAEGEAIQAKATL